MSQQRETKYSQAGGLRGKYNSCKGFGGASQSRLHIHSTDMSGSTILFAMFLYRITNKCLGAFSIPPSFNFHPLVWFKVFVVDEEMFDLLKRDFR